MVLSLKRRLVTAYTQSRMPQIEGVCKATGKWGAWQKGCSGAPRRACSGRVDAKVRPGEMLAGGIRLVPDD